MRKISPVGRTSGSSSDGPLWKDSLRRESLRTDGLTGQGLGKNKIGRLVTKRSKREVGGLRIGAKCKGSCVLCKCSPEDIHSEEDSH